MTDIASRIREIGEELVRCTRRCKGIRRKREGCIPRCLFLEAAKRRGSRGVAVVGMNLGQSINSERRYYLENGCTFESVQGWIAEHGLQYPYYAQLRKLVDAFALHGPVLWTELAKCENDDDVTRLPLQTFRTCTEAFLRHEIEALPNDWPLIAVGREAYNGLAYRFPSRTVIGVPHPTGSRGHFHRLFGGNDLHPDAVVGLRKVLRATGMVIWLAR